MRTSQDGHLGRDVWLGRSGAPGTLRLLPSPPKSTERSIAIRISNDLPADCAADKILPAMQNCPTNPPPHDNADPGQPTCEIRHTGERASTSWSLRGRDRFHIRWLRLLPLLLLANLGLVSAAQVRLAWDPSPDADVIGYRLYWGTQSRTYFAMTDVGNTTTASAGPLAGTTTYYFAVTAYNSSNLESDYSNEVEYTTPEDDPEVSTAVTVPETGEVGMILGGGVAGGAAGTPPPSENHPPVVSDQAVSVTEDGAVEITLNASDPEGDALSYTLVEGPASGVITGDPPAVTYQPAPGFSGSDRFTYKASDGREDSNLATVWITVVPVNHPPVISDLADQTTNPGLGVGPLAIAVDDADQPAESLVLVADSDNPALVPASNIIIGGTGANRTITVMPAANLSGTAVLTIAVTDGSLSTSTAFVLTVDPAVPPGWMVSDVGPLPAIPGYTAYAAGAFTVTGGVGVSSGGENPFHFVYQTMLGNGQIIARVSDFGDPTSQGKAGVMIRDLSGDQRGYLLMGLTPNGYFLDAETIRWRSPLPPPGQNVRITPPALAPDRLPLFPPPDNWVCLRRLWNRFYAYYSNDGITWRPAGPPVILDLPPTVAVGLAVSSSDPTQIHTVTFDNVSVTP